MLDRIARLYADGLLTNDQVARAAIIGWITVEEANTIVNG